MAKLTFSARDRAKAPIGLITLIVALFLAVLFRMSLVDAPAVDPDHSFQTDRVMAQLERILGDEAPHPIDSDASDGVIARIEYEIRALGLTPEIDDAFHCVEEWKIICGRVRNIRTWVGKPGPNAIMLASHHDSVPTGPGAGDDGMGVAASLEIARIMKARNPARPLLILITDGEEIGLLGASRFVETDPYAPLISAVVSLEARGNQGVATMFETSLPNSRDVAAVNRRQSDPAPRPLTNSLAADIYRAMPNGTDVTRYLTLDMDAANYSMIGRPQHYHTKHDDLAHLDPGSVFHVGASALAAVEGLMGEDPDAAETNLLYTDLLGRTVIALPQWMALPTLGLGALLGLIAVFRLQAAPRFRWRALLWPILVLVIGTGASLLGTYIVDMIRPESAFGTAHPWALRGTQTALALLGALLVSAWLYRAEDADRFVASAWLWILVLTAAAATQFPGASVLIVVPALIALPGLVLLNLRQSGLARLVLFAAAILMMALFLPAMAVGEMALFIESAGAFSLLTLFGLITLLPIVWRETARLRGFLAVAALASLAFLVAALAVPAYSADAPMGRSLTKISGDGVDGTRYILSARDPLNENWTAAAEFTTGAIENIYNNVHHAPAPTMQRTAPDITIAQNVLDADRRTIRLAVSSADTDRTYLALRGDRPTGATLSVNGFVLGPIDKALPGIECSGRTCRDLSVQLSFDEMEEPVEILLFDTAFGLGPADAPILAARPESELAQHDGDRRVIRRVLTLPAGTPPSPEIPVEDSDPGAETSAETQDAETQGKEN